MVDAIQLASPEQIAAAPGIGLSPARQVWAWFHPSEQADDPAGSPPADPPQPDSPQLAAAAAAAGPTEALRPRVPAG